MTEPEFQFRCERGHWSHTRNIDYRTCEARAQSADSGVHGPICGADIEQVQFDVDEFDAWRTAGWLVYNDPTPPEEVKPEAQRRALAENPYDPTDWQNADVWHQGFIAGFTWEPPPPEHEPHDAYDAVDGVTWKRDTTHLTL